MGKRLFLMAALLFVSVASMAQKVVNVDGKAVIDNRDMPAKAITTEKKARITDATNSISGTNNLNNLSSPISNGTVSHYFEVMKNDLDNGRIMDWLTAIQNCANYDSGDGKQEWRLPTQRESMLIAILRVSLESKVTDFVSFATSSYWSAFQYGRGDRGWLASFYDSITVDMSKTFAYRVRCVRDLTPPAK